MTTKLEYTPDIGIKLNSVTINWRTHRDNVRKLIDLPFEILDRVTHLGDKQTIESKRDAYQNVNGGDNYFFFNFNSDNVLTEIEIHWGVDIFVKDAALSFKNPIQDNVNALTKLTDNYKEIEPGNYFFPDLKLTIADEESLGGEGHNLGYFTPLQT